MTFIIARTASARPTLQHVLSIPLGGTTLCGLDTSRWSRAYQNQVIPQIACKKCMRASVPKLGQEEASS